MSDDSSDKSPPGMTELLQAQVGRIAEAMLAQREEERSEPAPSAGSLRRLVDALEARGHQPVPGFAEATAEEPLHALRGALAATAVEDPCPPRSSRPSEWRDSVPPAPRQFFTKHAAERLHERYGVAFPNMVATMAALSHQIRGTHYDGIEGVNLGKRPPSDGVNGTIWAVDIFHQPGFVVVDDDGVIVTALPRDSKQLQALDGPRRAALEAFRTELQLRHTGPVSLLKYQDRGSS